MSLDLGGAVNSLADRIGNAPLIRGIVRNPLFTALLIVALVAVVLMALYGRQIKAAGLKRGVRAFLYALLAVTGVMFVHHHVVTRQAQEEIARQNIRDVFSGLQHRVDGAGPDDEDAADDSSASAAADEASSADEAGAAPQPAPAAAAATAAGPPAAAQTKPRPAAQMGLRDVRVRPVVMAAS